MGKLRRGCEKKEGETNDVWLRDTTCIRKEILKKRRWQKYRWKKKRLEKETQTCIPHWPHRREPCVLWFRVKWGQLWLCRSPLLKWSTASHIIFCGAKEERGPLYSVEKNKGCGWKLPAGANCNISGASQGKTGRTTTPLIKRREAFPDWTAGERQKTEAEQTWRKQQRQTLRGEGMDGKDAQGSSGRNVSHVLLCAWGSICVKASSKRAFRD